MAILVTGGTGYIGSHTAVELLNAGEDIIIADNFYNSSPVVLDRITEISGKTPKFYNADLTDAEVTERIFSECDVEAVIHFAGYKAVGESVARPLKYYENNIISTLNVLNSMKKYGCKRFVFSSSATVYGIPEKVPITEDAPRSAINPYGQTKLMIEHILEDVCAADSEMSVALLRYFNPIGAHESGKLGEDPKGIPNNLMPYITKVASGELECLHVFGNDYPTPDGTGVRDYIHVVDLAKGHLSALAYIRKNKGIIAVNLGTGKGCSVLELVSEYEAVINKKLNMQIDARRPGDSAECYANASKAKRLFGWSAKYDLHRMCVDSYRWQTENPHGYGDK